MKKLASLFCLLLAVAGTVYLQNLPSAAPTRDLAALMPGSALLYLESPDFGRLLRNWDQSKVKSDWLATGNFAVFSRSNLYTKLAGVYNEYGEAAGFLPDLKSLIEIAGSQSALALYQIRDVEFLYVTRIPESALASSPLWAVRAHFEQRQAGGHPFYLRTDPATNRTVTFASANGYLILATRDDLVAQSLELLSGTARSNIAADLWYREAVAQATVQGDLRLVMNLDPLVKSDYFRSYWIQHNASTVRRYWTGIADVTQSPDRIVETRAFLHSPDTAAATANVAALLALVPPDAGVYKAAAIADSSVTASMIVNKLIASPQYHERDWRFAPDAVSPDTTAGAGSDLETRIDEQPLPADAGISDSVTAVRALLDKSHAQSSLLVQSSAARAATYLDLPCAIALYSPGPWDRDAVRTALAAAAGKLWTTSQLGARWTRNNAIERLDGLGSLMFTTNGSLLFLGNDPGLLARIVSQAGNSAPAAPLTYAAGFRHSWERANFERIMTALDFSAPANGDMYSRRAPGEPGFFTGNIAGLSRTLSKIAEMNVTQGEKGPATVETVVYRLEP